MKKKPIIFGTIFFVLFLLTRPDKIIKGLFLFNNFLVTEIPKTYKIKEVDKKAFVYAIDYKNFYPILFFRNDFNDYILFKLNCNLVNLKEKNTDFETTTNTISSSFKFKYGVADFYLANASLKNSNITINGYDLKYTNLNNSQIFETDNDFEIFQNDKRIFYYQGNSNAKKFILIKKEKIPLFYIIETKELKKEAIVDEFLK